MATPLTKAVSRLELRNNMIVTLAPDGVYVREKGKRTSYGPLSYLALQLHCARINAAATMAEREDRKPVKRRVSRNLLG